MNENLTPLQSELLKRADVVMDYVGKATVSAVEFAKEQIPEIAIQYVTYYRTYLTALIIFSVFLIGFSIWCWRKLSKNPSDLGWEISGGIFSAMTGILMLLANFSSFIMAWTAPKIFLLQHLTHLIKTVKG